MTYNELKQWLIQEHGATFRPGSGRHLKVTINEITITWPSRGSGDGEMPEILREMILDLLGLRPE